MKFLVNEHKDFEQILNANGFEEKDYSFTKKRGQIEISLSSIESDFPSFRKKESRINEHGQFTDHVTYLIGKDKKTVLSSREEVKVSFEKFLKS